MNTNKILDITSTATAGTHADWRSVVKQSRRSQKRRGYHAPMGYSLTPSASVRHPVQKQVFMKPFTFLNYTPPHGKSHHLQKVFTRGRFIKDMFDDQQQATWACCSVTSVQSSHLASPYRSGLPVRASAFPIRATQEIRLQPSEGNKNPRLHFPQLGAV